MAYIPDKKISTMKPRDPATGEKVPLPDGYVPFYFHFLKSDGEIVGYVRDWTPLVSRMEFDRISNDIAIAQCHSLREIAPEGALKYKTSKKSVSEIGNFLHHNGFLLMSDCAVSIVKKYACENLEFFPIEIELFKKNHAKGGDNVTDNLSSLYGGGEVVSGYWLVNFLNVEDVIDLDNSELEYQVRQSGQILITDFNLLSIRVGVRPFGLYKVAGFATSVFVSTDLNDDLVSSGFEFISRPMYSLAGAGRYIDLEKNSVPVDRMVGA